MTSGAMFPPVTSTTEVRSGSRRFSHAAVAAAPAGSAVTCSCRVQARDRRQHLPLAHGLDLVHQLTNGGDVRRERAPHGEAVRDGVRGVGFNRRAFCHER